MKKHNAKFKETRWGWSWKCSCGSKVQHPLFSLKEHAVGSWEKHQVSAQEIERTR